MTALNAEIVARADPGIAPAVRVLLDAGIETFESCQGGRGHCYPEPTVRFFGQRSEGFRALAAVRQLAFRVHSLRRIWPIIDGEPTGPYWELVFEAGLYEDAEQSRDVLVQAANAGTAQEWFRARERPHA